MVNKKRKPKFNVQNLGFNKMVKARWRKPRGVGNKKRRKEWWAGASPRIGYKNAPAVRGMHPSGLPEELIANLAQLKGLSNKIIRIQSAVGTRKALEIEKAARAAGLQVANPRKVKPKEAKAEKGKEARTGSKAPAKTQEQKQKPVASKGPEPVGPQPPSPQMQNPKPAAQNTGRSTGGN